MNLKQLLRNRHPTRAHTLTCTHMCEPYPYDSNEDITDPLTMIRFGRASEMLKRQREMVSTSERFFNNNEMKQEKKDYDYPWYVHHMEMLTRALLVNRIISLFLLLVGSLFFQPFANDYLRRKRAQRSSVILCILSMVLFRPDSMAADIPGKVVGLMKWGKQTVMLDGRLHELQFNFPLSFLSLSLCVWFFPVKPSR